MDFSFSNHRNLRKILLLLCVFLTFFGLVVVPTVTHAFFPALFLPAGISAGAAVIGQAALILGIVAAGMYVGGKTPELKTMYVRWTNATGAYWTSLSASTKAKFAAASASLSATATDLQNVVVDSEMNAAIKDYMKLNVSYESTKSYENVPPAITATNISADGSIATAAYANTYKALWCTIGANYYVFIPVTANFNHATQLFTSGGGVTYSWAKLLTDGTYSVQRNGIGTGVGSAGNLLSNINGGGNTWQGNEMTFAPVGYAAVWSGLNGALGQYKRIAEIRMNVSIGAADWVDVATPDWRTIPDIGELKIPAGVIGGTGTATTVSVSDVQAITIGTSVPGTADPGDPGGGGGDPDNLPPIDFSPLVMVGDVLKTKFPLSIPWDFHRQLMVFNVAAKTPHLYVDNSIVLPLIGNQMHIKFDVDFTMFDPIALIVRWFLIIAFDVALILGLRRLIPS